MYKKTRNTSAMRCWNFYLKQYCRLVLNSFAYKVHDNVVACLIRASIMQVMQISRYSLRKKKPLNTTDEKYTLLQIKSTNSQQLIHDVYSKGWLYYQRWGKRSVTELNTSSPWKRSKWKPLCLVTKYPAQDSGIWYKLSQKTKYMKHSLKDIYSSKKCFSREGFSTGRDETTCLSQGSQSSNRTEVTEKPDRRPLSSRWHASIMLAREIHTTVCSAGTSRYKVLGNKSEE